MNRKNMTSAGHQGSTPAPVLDVKASLERLAGDATLFGEVARVFLKTVPPLLSSVATALMANDMARATLDAHSVKGAVGAFEAPEVFNSLALVEHFAKNADRDAAATAFEKAKPLVDRLLSELAVSAAA